MFLWFGVFIVSLACEYVLLMLALMQCGQSCVVCVLLSIYVNSSEFYQNVTYKFMNPKFRLLLCREQELNIFEFLLEH